MENEKMVCDWCGAEATVITETDDTHEELHLCDECNRLDEEEEDCPDLRDAGERDPHEMI